MMPTSSILKEFVIKDNEACDRLIEALSGKASRRMKPTTRKYEEGQRLLHEYEAREKRI